MKKTVRVVIGVLLMILVIGIFGWFTLQKVAKDGTEFSLTNLFNTDNDEETLEEIAIQLDTNYPQQVKEVIEIYNKLLNLYYRGKVGEEQLEAYVIATRKIYSNELNNLNPIQQQIEALKNEKEGQPVASKIQDIYIQRDENDEDIRAEVVIIYATNTVSFKRHYNLIKEKDYWKINGWKDYPINEEEATALLE